MQGVLEILHLLMLSFFMGWAYKAVTGKVKRRFTFGLTVLSSVARDTTTGVSTLLSLGCGAALSIGVIEALRVGPKTKRLNVRQ
jgi:hypothetical protein